MKQLFILLFFGSLIIWSSCSTTMVITSNAPGLKTVAIDQKLLTEIETKVNSPKSKEPPVYVCGTTPMPTLLKELNRNEIFTSNVTIAVDASLSAYGFSGTMGKKDVLIAAYMIKFKDYTCDGVTRRVLVGIKLYVHASEVKFKASSPTLPMIAAAVELGMAKAEYKFETIGLNPDGFYQNLPSAQFSVDTYSKVISAYDNIIHSLNDTTAIDPIVIMP